MKKFVLLCIVLLCPLALRAEGGSLGAGATVGNISGFCAKYWLTSYQAVDGAVSMIEDNNLYVHADYLFHDFRTLPKPEKGRLPLYYGPGIELESRGVFGVRAVGGICYMFEDYPFDLFIEIAPVLKFSSENTVLNFSGNIGLRYYWQ
jgi:hypothetical protein